MTFSFNGRATIEHVNLRKEGATEAKHLACDIKLATVCGADVLIPFNPALRTLLFTPEGEPRVPNIKPIGLEGSIKHLRCEFTDWQVDLSDVEAKKFTFSPLPGDRVEMVFSVAVEPRPDQTGRLADMLGEQAVVRIGVESDLLAQEARYPALSRVLGRQPEDVGKPTPAKAPSKRARDLADEIIAQGPEVVLKAAKAQRKAAKPFDDPQDGEKPAGKCWTADELLARIPPAQGGHVLVLRAIGPAREEFIELRLNTLDDRGLRVQVGYECQGKGTGTFTAPTVVQQRGMLEDAITDVLVKIRERYKWKHLADAVIGWPLSKAFRNIGCRAI